MTARVSPPERHLGRLSSKVVSGDSPFQDIRINLMSSSNCIAGGRLDVLEMEIMFASFALFTV